MVLGKDPSIGENILQHSYLCQQNFDGAFWAGHVDNAKLRLYSWLDDSFTISTHDVPIGNWPNTSDYSSIAPDHKDWLSPGGSAEISGFVRNDHQIWLAWTASRGSGTIGGFHFPNSQVRVAKIRITDWTLVSEMQV
jgi:hypothetical protein